MRRISASLARPPPWRSGARSARPLVEVRICPVDVGRVGDDHRKARRLAWRGLDQRFEPAAVAHLDGQTKGGAVGTGQGCRCRHPVHRPYIGIRSLRLERQCNGAGAGAQISRAQGPAGSRASACSTSTSVSGRGIRVAGLTLSGSDQNSRSPMRWAMGSPLRRRSSQPCRMACWAASSSRSGSHQVAAPALQQMAEQRIGIGAGDSRQGRHDVGASLLDLHQLLGRGGELIGLVLPIIGLMTQSSPLP